MNIDSINLKIAQIWEGVLSRPVDNIHDDFYMMGGSSIYAMKINMLILKEFNIEYDLKMYESCSTVHEQSEFVYSKLMVMENR